MVFSDSTRGLQAGVHVQPLVVLLLVAVAAARGQGQEVTSTPLDEHYVQDVLQQEANKWADVYLPTAVSPSSPCGRALMIMYESLAENMTLWAATMVDAWGKTADGVFFGNFMFTGLYDECVYTASPDEGVKGKYCTVTATVSDEQQLSITAKRPMPYILPRVPWLGPELDEGDRQTRTVVNSIATLGAHYGTCMPDVCTESELTMSVNYNNQFDSKTHVVAVCYTNKPEPQFTDADAGFMGFITFIVTLIICSSVVDIYLTYVGNTRLRKTVLRYLLVFSAYTNLHKMLQINPHPAPGTISCLNGVRVLSMTWVLYAHQQATTFFNTANLLDVRKWAEGILAQTISNGFPSVDTFFFISGMLVAYSVLRELGRRRKFNVFLFFFHRFIRLIPPLAIVAGFMATVLRFFVSGPNSDIWTNYWQTNCVENWWKDILFVNNFLYDNDCVAQAWYVAVDTQLYLIAPLVILPLFFFEGRGKAWLFVVTVLSTVVPSVIIYANNYPPTSLMYGPEGNEEYFDNVYLMPWCRAAPWMVGVWLGYIFYKQGNKRVKMSALVVTLGWTLATVTGLLVVYGLASYNHFFDPAPYEVMTQIVYGGGHRLAWGAALAWLVFACHNGYGGVVDEFLSHPAWQPISRLTYSIYLVAFPLQFLIAYNLRVASYYNYINKIIETVGALVLSLPAAVLVSLMAESPVMGFERLLLRPNTRTTRKEESNAPRRESAKGQLRDNEEAEVNNPTFAHEENVLDGKVEAVINVDEPDEVAEAGWERRNGEEHDGKTTENDQKVTSL